ncbi:hypothetical protein LOTGIDRAFT_163992, partial [Lottia gigantea]
MASFFRRRRGLLFKAVIAVPLLWIVVVVVFSTSGKLNSDQPHWQQVEIEKREEAPLHAPPESRRHHENIHNEPQRDNEKIHKNDVENNEDKKKEKDHKLKFRSHEQKEEEPAYDPNAP